MKRTMPKNSLLKTLVSLLTHISKKRKIQLSLTIVLMMFVAVLEMVSLGLVIPFLSILTSPDVFYEKIALLGNNELLKFIKENVNSLSITILFCIVTVVAGLSRVILLWMGTKVSFSTGADINKDVFQKTISQPYLVHVNRNTSELINSIFGNSKNVILTISAVLTLISSIFIMTAILITLLMINSIMTISMFILFSFIYAGFIFFTRKKQLGNSELMHNGSASLIKILQESLGGVRDIILDGTQKFHVENFASIDAHLRRAQASTIFINGFPKHVIESIGILGITGFGYFITIQNGNVSAAVPIIGGFAFGAQKILPLAQQIYTSWSSLLSNYASLNNLLSLLQQKNAFTENDKKNKLHFSHELKVQDIFFKYKKSSKWILNGITLTIKKGSVTGLMGVSGGGKSTFLDVMMGLLEPNEGFISIDGKHISFSEMSSWAFNISHVPQTIYLSDASIAMNISLKNNPQEIDQENLLEAVKKAQLEDFIKTLPNGLDTFVGERGIMLSGGQRQRIGIARALYKKSDVLILDEATSALDSETEREIMKTVNELSDQITIIMVAHRLSSLEICDDIYKIKDGKLEKLKAKDLAD